MRPPRSALTKARVARAGTYGVLALGSAISLAPFYYIIRVSLQTSAAYREGTGGVSLSSWSAALTHTDVLAQTGHSALLTLSSVALIVAFSLLAGYAYAKLRPRAASVTFVAIVAGFMIPVQSVVVPLYLNFARVGLVDTYVGAALVYGGLQLPFSVFLMTSYFRSLPDEIMEAALLDGLGYVGVLFRVLLPLAAPAMVTVGVLAFIAVWNDLLVAMLWLPSPDHRTITAGLASLTGERVVPVPEITAASLIQAMPAIAVFLVFQRQMVRGLTLGVGR
jgi:ABC-type glycerol-3-phosphate transport system permease component